MDGITGENAAAAETADQAEGFEEVELETISFAIAPDYLKKTFTLEELPSEIANMQLEILAVNSQQSGLKIDAQKLAMQLKAPALANLSRKDEADKKELHGQYKQTEEMVMGLEVHKQELIIVMNYLLKLFEIEMLKYESANLGTRQPVTVNITNV